MEEGARRREEEARTRRQQKILHLDQKLTVDAQQTCFHCFHWDPDWDNELEERTSRGKGDGKGNFDPQAMRVAAKGAGKGDHVSRRGKGLDIRDVDPSSIEFSQYGINPIRFADGRLVQDLIADLETGVTQPMDVPLIRVFERRDGTLLTHDNRRLYCFKRGRVCPAAQAESGLVREAHEEEPRLPVGLPDA